MRKRFWVLLTAVLMLGVVGCSSASNNNNGASGNPSGSPSGSKQGGGTLTVALQGDIQSLDPAFSYDTVTNMVVTNVTEGLLKMNSDGTLSPNLAEKWESPDPKTYIYHIRKGVTFSDGSPMTVDDVIFSLERIRDPKLASYVAWMYGNVDKIEKVDDATVKVTLKQNDAFWQYVVATTAGHVVSKKYAESHPTFGKPDGGVMGTGAYKFVSWQGGSEIVLEKNAGYWDKGAAPFFDKVVFKVLGEGTTRVTGLKTGEIDAIIAAVPVDQLPLVEKMDNVTVVKAPGNGADVLAFNVSRPPFNDVNLRKAIAYAIDAKALQQQISGGAAQTPAASLLPPGNMLVDKAALEQAAAKLPAYQLNMDKAKEFLAKSAYAGGVKATLLTTKEEPVYWNYAQAVASAVKPLGIDLQVEAIPSQELTTAIFGKKDYDAAMCAWFSDFPDPAGNIFPTFLASNGGEGGANFFKYANPKVDELLNKQNALTDGKQRVQILIEAQAMIADEVPMLVVDYPYTIGAFKKGLTGYQLSPYFFWQSWAKDMKR